MGDAMVTGGEEVTADLEGCGSGYGWKGNVERGGQIEPLHLPFSSPGRLM